MLVWLVDMALLGCSKWLLGKWWDVLDDPSSSGTFLAHYIIFQVKTSSLSVSKICSSTSHMIWSLILQVIISMTMSNSHPDD